MCKRSANPGTTLKEKLPGPGDTHNDQKWTEFAEMYRPYVCSVAIQVGLKQEDAEDVAQNVMRELWDGGMRTFNYDPGKGKFRSYLKTIASRRAIDYKRKRNPAADNKQRVHRKPDEYNRIRTTSTIDQQPDLDTSTRKKTEEKEWAALITRRALSTLRNNPKVSAKHFQIFCASCISGQPVAELCSSLGINPQNVYTVKNRLLPLYEEACKEARRYADSPVIPECRNRFHLNQNTI